MITSSYIHIPFCRRKCKYCSFVSYKEPDFQTQYVDALCGEIKNRYCGEKLKTLYIGGGTPSLLTVSEIEKILENFSFEKNAEITIEANPEKLQYEWFKDIKQLGINRLSLGVQSFDDALLKKIGREHSVNDIFHAVKNARNAGFENINADLIYGLPEQKMSDFSASIAALCELELPHISSYGLKIEENSYFYNHYPENLPDEDIQADMYLKLIEITEKYGYEHYEISNFAQIGFESKHNLNYWNAGNYYGFGCAACGYEANLRYSHKTKIREYIENPSLLTEKEILSAQIKLEEKIFLGLRKTEGINVSEINQLFNINFEQKYGNVLEKYKKYFIRTSNGYALNNSGFLISNNILSEFVE